MVQKKREGDQSLPITQKDFRPGYNLIISEKIPGADEKVLNHLAKLAEIYTRSRIYGQKNYHLISGKRCVDAGCNIAYMVYQVCQESDSDKDIFAIQSLEDIQILLYRGSGLDRVIQLLSNRFGGYSKERTKEEIQKFLEMAGYKNRIKKIRTLEYSLFSRLSSLEGLKMQVADIERWFFIVSHLTAAKEQSAGRKRVNHSLFAKGPLHTKEGRNLSENYLVYTILMSLTLGVSFQNGITLKDLQSFIDTVNDDYVRWNSLMPNKLKRFPEIGERLMALQSTRRAMSNLGKPEERNILLLGEKVKLEPRSRALLDACKQYLEFAVNVSRFVPDMFKPIQIADEQALTEEERDALEQISDVVNTTLLAHHPSKLYSFLKQSPFMIFYVGNEILTRLFVYAELKGDNDLIEIMLKMKPAETLKIKKLSRKEVSVSVMLRMVWEENFDGGLGLLTIAGKDSRGSFLKGGDYKKTLSTKKRGKKIFARIVEGKSYKFVASFVKTTAHIYSKYGEFPNVEVLPGRILALLHFSMLEKMPADAKKEATRCFEWFRYLSTDTVKDYFLDRIATTT